MPNAVAAGSCVHNYAPIPALRRDYHVLQHHIIFDPGGKEKIGCGIEKISLKYAICIFSSFEGNIVPRRMTTLSCIPEFHFALRILAPELKTTSRAIVYHDISPLIAWLDFMLLLYVFYLASYLKRLRIFF
jgi:hypothetical protein